MDYVYKLVTNVKYYYDSMNPAFLSGAIDVIVVEQPDGTLLSTPFHVRFGRYSVFNSDDKIIDVQINDEEIDMKMKLGENGVAFFVEETVKGEKVPFYLATSRIPTHPPDTSLSANGEIPSPASPSSAGLSSTSTVARKSSRVSTSKDDALLVSGSNSPSVQQPGLKRPPSTPSMFPYRHYRSLPDLSDLRENSHGGMESPSSSGPGTSRDTTPLGGSSETLTIGNAAHGPREKDGGVKLDVGDIADGAMSDSEIDHNPHHHTYKRNRQGETEWKWGEFPESSKEGKEKKARQRQAATGVDDSAKGGRSYGWGWFRWSRGAGEAAPNAVGDVEKQQFDASTMPNGVPPIVDPVPPSVPITVVTGTKHEGKRRKKDGLYLEDIADDPSKMATYFGRRTGAASVSSNVDSGNGHSSLGTSPCSPSALSLNEEPLALSGLALLNDLNSDITSTAEQIDPTAARRASAGESLLVRSTASEDQAPCASTQEGGKDAESGTAPDGIERDNGAITPVSPSQAEVDKRRYDSGESSGLGTSDEETASSELVSSNYKRSLRLPSDKLKSLGLNYGSNEARFSITTKFQGTAWCVCHIYLLKWNQKLVVSDIDGTITKSDVLGHVIPAIGGTWAHAAVADLYTRIHNNGYQMVYLSSRAIGQSHYTKAYLQNIAQGTKRLPDGPVLLSPTSVLLAFRKEVIERRPEEFKIACLSDLKALFPVKQPFYAGFGNRPTDVKSYSAVEIPLERIFIINPYSILSRADQSSYVTDFASMASSTVDFLFPPLSKFDSQPMTPFSKPTQFSNFTFWRPSREEEVASEELEKYTAKSKQLSALKRPSFGSVGSKKTKKNSSVF